MGSGETARKSSRVGATGAHTKIDPPDFATLGETVRRAAIQAGLSPGGPFPCGTYSAAIHWWLPLPTDITPETLEIRKGNFGATEFVETGEAS